MRTHACRARVTRRWGAVYVQCSRAVRLSSAIATHHPQPLGSSRSRQRVRRPCLLRKATCRPQGASSALSQFACSPASAAVRQASTITTIIDNAKFVPRAVSTAARQRATGQRAALDHCVLRGPLDVLAPRALLKRAAQTATLASTRATLDRAAAQAAPQASTRATLDRAAAQAAPQASTRAAVDRAAALDLRVPRGPSDVLAPRALLQRTAQAARLASTRAILDRAAAYCAAIFWMVVNAEANTMTGRAMAFAWTVMRAKLTRTAATGPRVHHQAKATLGTRATVTLKTYSASHVSILVFLRKATLLGKEMGGAPT
eukprot:COSAG02_NODE_293_length_25438_cov_52.630254_6_plen_317_part_00